MLPRDSSKNTSPIFVHFSIDYILLFSKTFSSLFIESTSLICNNSLLPTFLAFFSYSKWMCYYHYPAWGWCNELQYLCYSFSAKVVLKILKERGIAHNTSCIINFCVAAVSSIRVVYTLCAIAINHRRKSTTYICIHTYIVRDAIVFFFKFERFIFGSYADFAIFNRTVFVWTCLRYFPSMSMCKRISWPTMQG